MVFGETPQISAELFSCVKIRAFNADSRIGISRWEKGGKNLTGVLTLSSLDARAALPQNCSPTKLQI
jgi:hypothetical protein